MINTMKLLTMNGARNLAHSAHNHVRQLLSKTENTGMNLMSSNSKPVSNLTSRNSAKDKSKKSDGRRTVVSSGILEYHPESEGEKCLEENGICVPSQHPELESEASCSTVYIQSSNQASSQDRTQPIELEECLSVTVKRETSPAKVSPKPKTSILPYKHHLSSFTLNSGNPSHDLKRFLEVVGTEPKEARYWFKHFQKITNNNPLFAVIQIEEDVIQMSEKIHNPGTGMYHLNEDSPLNELCSYLAFLQRHDMKCVVLHGRSQSKNPDVSPECLQQQIIYDAQLITDLLEKNGARVRQIGIPPLEVEALQSGDGWSVSHIDPRYLDWVQSSGNIPVLSNIALTTKRQLVNLDLFETTTAVSKSLLPLKVLIVNMEGGIVDQDGKVIANINLPHDEYAALMSPWCTPAVKDTIHDIKSLLTELQEEHHRLGKNPDSAIIITSATTLLTELFTHYGSGTFFKITEKINKYHSLAEVDIRRLSDLMQMAFGRNLKENYMESIAKNLDAIYVSEGYSAAAIITKDGRVPVPYLDKFAVRKDSQDNSVGRMLWDRVGYEYPQMYWRSRHTNLINPWYFKRSEGSWSDGTWTVFWYGIPQHRDTSLLIDDALSRPNSFVQGPDPEPPGSKTNGRKSSKWSALQYMSSV